MKYIIFLLLLILSVSSQAAPVCSKNGTTIIYTNGVTTKKVDALKAMWEIDALGLDSQIDLQKVNDSVLAYNYEESVAKDFLEAAVQRIPNIYLTKMGTTNPYAALSGFYYGKGLTLISFQAYLKLMEALSDDFTQSLNNYLVTQKNNPTYTTTVKEIKKHYTDAFGRGERVFAVSHSQGGLFMNDVYNLLQENDNKRKFFSGFQIASPLANVMDSHFGYATHDKDNLINLIRSTVGALPANIVAPSDLTNGISTAPSIEKRLQDFVIEYFLNHGIQTTYLFNSKIKENLISELIATAQLLESNCPKAVINYTKSNLQVNFDSTDPENPNVTGLTYSWNFGDGQTANTASKALSHTYAQAGTYNVSLTVTDSYGITDSAYRQVSLGNLDNISFNIEVINSSYRYMPLYDDSVPRYAGVYHSLSMSALITGEIGTSITMQSHGELYDMDCGSWEKTNPPSQINNPIFLTCTRTQLSPKTTSITARDVSQCGGEGCFFLQLPFWQVTRPGAYPENVYPMTGVTPENVGEIHFTGPSFPSPSYF